MQCSGMEVTDLWMDERPAHGLNNSRNCTQENQTAGCVYEDRLFSDRVLAAIRPQQQQQQQQQPAPPLSSPAPTAAAAAGRKPFFIFWAPRIVHSPLQVPDHQLQHFDFIGDTPRRCSTCSGQY